VTPASETEAAAVIVDPDELRVMLGVPAAGQNAAVLTIAHRRAERLVKDEVGYEVEQATHVELLPAYDPSAPLADPFTSYGPTGLYEGGGHGFRADCLFLRHLPVRSITSVEVDATGAFAGAQTALSASLYRLDCCRAGVSESGLLVASGAAFPTTPRTVRVTYVGGWTEDELDDAAGVFRAATVQAAAQFYNQTVANMAAVNTAGTGAVASEETDGQTFQYARAAQNHGFMSKLPESVIRMLAPHVNIRRKYLE
jgi:hypothetical protein